MKRSSPGLAASDEERIAHRVWIGGAVKTLLTMYGDWPSDPRVEAEWGKAWADDLEWFPQDVIEAALTTWRRSETRRPTPAAIIVACRERMPRVVALPAPDACRPEPSPESRARVSALVASAFPELRRIPKED